jgi:hypothetical protein
MTVIGFKSVIFIMGWLHCPAIAIVSQQGRVSKLRCHGELMRSMASTSMGLLESTTKNRRKL